MRCPLAPIENPAREATDRWLASNDAGNVAAVIGDPSVSEVSLTFAAGKVPRVDLIVLVTTWMPNGYGWVVPTLKSVDGADFHMTKWFTGGSVTIATVTASDGTRVVVAIDKG